MKSGDEWRLLRIVAQNWRKFFNDTGIGFTPAIRHPLDFVRHVQREAQAMVEEGISAAALVSPITENRCQHLLSQNWDKELAALLEGSS